MKVGDSQHIAIWDAINKLVEVSGGCNTTSSNARMTAVVDVERAIEKITSKHKPKSKIKNQWFKIA